MTLAEFSVVATLVFAVLQVLHIVLFTKTRTLSEKRRKTIVERSFWTAVAAVTITFIAMFIWPVVSPRIGDGKIEAAPAPGEEEAEVRRVIRDSQIRETLEFYGDPRNVDRQKMNEYWRPGSEAAKDIEISLADLRRHGWHYGAGSKLVAFTFRYVRIFDGRRAEVGTSEQWYLPMVRSDGSRVKERSADFGPYNVDYTLQKIADHWFLETTNTPYAHKK